MTKPEDYALGGMIMRADRSGTIAVQATRPVRRSYMFIDDMLRIAMDAVGRLGAGGSVMFETAGEVVEMGDLAARVLGVLGHNLSAVSRPPINPSLPADDCLGDSATLDALARTSVVTPLGLDAQIAITADWLLTVLMTYGDVFADQSFGSELANLTSGRSSTPHTRERRWRLW